jgi:polyhydroxybutyrate depolymerase
MDPKQISVNGTTRTYYAAGDPKSTTALLVFHGGGENAGYDENGILGYSGLANAGALVLSFQGQDADNGYSWLNAFPWLKSTASNTAYYSGSSAVPDDVAFVASVLALYKPKKVFATGKSDGAGFVALLIDRFLSLVPIAAAAVCSSALFYTTTGTVAQPSLNGVPFLEMHGTEDTVMPYNGQQFTAAPSSPVWSLVDPTTKNTYTAGAYNWLLRQNKNTDPTRLGSIGSDPVYQWPSTGTVHIMVVGGGHDWFGHTGSTTGVAFDATAVVLKFLGIPYPATPAPYLSIVPAAKTAAPRAGLSALVITGIVTLVLAVLFLIWSIVIIARCGKKTDDKPLFDALIALLVLSIVLSWVPGLGQLLTLGLLITLVIGTIRC